MTTLVLNKDSMSVNLESDHLIIRRHDMESDMQTIPIKDVERVIVIGRPAITFRVLARFMDRGIPCSFITKGGRLRGVFDNGYGRNVSRRILQYDKFRDPVVCLSLAKGVIKAKLRNCRRVIQRLCANRGMSISNLVEHWADLNAAVSEVDSAGTLDILRGVEGVGSFHYFRLLDNFLPSDFKFTARSRRPPLDPINSLSSLRRMREKHCHIR